MKKAIVAVAVLALIGGALYWRYWKRTEAQRTSVEVSGIIECEEARVGSREGGRVKEVVVNEGDIVNAGQALVRLESDTLDAALSEAESAAAAAKARLDQLRNGATPEEIQAAEAAVKIDRARLEQLQNGATAEEIQAAQAAVDAQEQQVELLDKGTRREQIDAARADRNAARENYENLRLAYERQENLLQSGVVSQQVRDNAKTAMEAAAQQVHAKQALYDMAVNGPRAQEKRAARELLAKGDAELRRIRKGPRAEEIAQARAAVEYGDAQLRHIRKGARVEEIAQSQAALDQAKARVESIRTRLKEMVIRAPEKCTVEAIDLNPGDLVAPGEEVARLVLHQDLWVRVFVPEDMLGLVRVGARVPLYVDSSPGRAFEGRIARVSRKAEFTPRNVQTPEGRSMQVFRTKVMVTDKSELLRPGMTATIRLKRKPRK